MEGFRKSVRQSLFGTGVMENIDLSRNTTTTSTNNNNNESDDSDEEVERYIRGVNHHHQQQQHGIRNQAANPVVLPSSSSTSSLNNNNKENKNNNTTTTTSLALFLGLTKSPPRRPRPGFKSFGRGKNAATAATTTSLVATEEDGRNFGCRTLSHISEEGLILDSASSSDDDDDDEDNNNDGKNETDGLMKDNADHDNNRRRWFSTPTKVILALVFVVIHMIMIVWIVKRRVQRGSGQEQQQQQVSSSSTGSSFNDGSTIITATTDRLEDLKFLVIHNQWSLKNDVYNMKSPQYQAIEYLAVTDPRQVPIDDENSMELMERYALAVLYYSTGGSNNNTTTSWTSTVNWMNGNHRHVCDWNAQVTIKEDDDNNNNNNNKNEDNNKILPIGIVACTSGKHVQDIRLPSNNLKGTIPNELGLLQELTHLNLYNNHLFGTVLPEGLRLNTELRSLLLHNNHDLTGTIPTWLCLYLPGLEILYLSHNSITGTLPHNLHKCEDMRVLNLDGNTLEGTLESAFKGGNGGRGMQYLELLSMDDNLISGSLTDDLLNSSWPALQVLDLGQNSITGSLPSTLLSHVNLQFIDLHNNLFQGELPTLFRMNAPLQFLALHNNDLQGHIGATTGIFELEQLQHLDLSSNAFSGTFPTTNIGTLSSLEYLYVAFNRGFEPGPIPTELGQLKQLQYVSFQATNRVGQIPFELQHCKHLKLLDLNENHLTGDIPGEIGAGLHELQSLLLQGNAQLTGTIPTTFTKLRYLETLVLYGTGITGGTANVCNSDTNATALKHFVAQCDNFRNDNDDEDDDDVCPCCTSCCRSGELPACGSTVWLDGQVENPVSNLKFLRDDYTINDPKNLGYSDVSLQQDDNDDEDEVTSDEEEDDEDEIQYKPNLLKPTTEGMQIITKNESEHP